MINDFRHRFNRPNYNHHEDFDLNNRAQHVYVWPAAKIEAANKLIKEGVPPMEAIKRISNDQPNK